MQEIRMSFFISMEEIWKHIFMWLRGRVRGCADVFVAARMCLWLCGRVCGCADVFVAVRTCLWLCGRVRGCADVSVTAGQKPEPAAGD